MTVERLIKELKLFPMEAIVNVKVIVFNSDGDIIDDTDEEIENIIYVDNFDKDCNEVYLKINYTEKDEECELLWD